MRERHDPHVDSRCPSPISGRSGYTTSTGEFHASKEMIVSADAYLLSGPASTLTKHGIPLVLDLSDVGQNLHEHFSLPLYGSR